MKDVEYQMSYWWQAWAGWFEGAAELGVQFDADTFALFTDWAKDVLFVAFAGKAVVVAERPELVMWRDGLLHNDSGPSLRFSDGWSLWMIGGVRVTQQIVEDPASLTVEQIDNEKNAEVQRIMRERFGEGRYLRETGATVVHMDYETARKGAAPRALMQGRNGVRWLVGTDGSTKRVYYMQVRSDVQTCRDAHESLCGFPESKIVNKS